jgi:CDP-diacylglycerol---glycerol-3-phosphate 3-phosphatidyltransferase
MSVVSPNLRTRVRGIATPIAVAMGKVGLTPNALTLLGFGIAIIAAVAAATQNWLIAGLLVVFGGVFDLFDGALARATGKASKLGAFMDSVFDRWGEGIIYVGIAAGCVAADFGAGAVLSAAALASAFMVSYARAKSEGLGFTEGTGMAAVGLAPREVRIVILTIGLVWAGLAGGVVTADFVAGNLQLIVALGLITVLGTITVIQRIVHVLRQPIPEEHQ